MAHQDVLDLVLAENGVVDVQRCAAGIAENILDAGVLKRADEHVAAGK